MFFSSEVKKELVDEGRLSPNPLSSGDKEYILSILTDVRPATKGHLLRRRSFAILAMINRLLYQQATESGYLVGVEECLRICPENKENFLSYPYVRVGLAPDMVEYNEKFWPEAITTQRRLRDVRDLLSPLELWRLNKREFQPNVNFPTQWRELNIAKMLMVYEFVEHLIVENFGFEALPNHSGNTVRILFEALIGRYRRSDETEVDYETKTTTKNPFNLKRYILALKKFVAQQRIRLRDLQDPRCNPEHQEDWWIFNKKPIQNAWDWIQQGLEMLRKAEAELWDSLYGALSDDENAYYDENGDLMGFGRRNRNRKACSTPSDDLYDLDDDVMAYHGIKTESAESEDDRDIYGASEPKPKNSGPAWLDTVLHPLSDDENAYYEKHGHLLGFYS